MSDELRHSIIEATNFLNYDAPIKVRVSYIIQSITQQKTCIECNTLIVHNVPVQRSSDFCSLKCSKTSNRTKQRRIDTNINRHGIGNPFSDTDKIKTAISEKYDVDNISHLQSTKEKISIANKENSKNRMIKQRLTVQQKYGVEHCSQIPSVIEKKKETVKTRFGVDYTFQSPEIQEKIEQTNLSRYGVRNPSMNKDVIARIAETKNTLYNSPTYNNRDKAKASMDVKYGCHAAQAHWSALTYSILNDVEQLTAFMKTKTINNAADELGIAPTTLWYKLREMMIDDFVKRSNSYELFICNMLDAIDIKYIRNDRTILNGKELDFYLPDYNLAIECNGIFWHSELMGKDKFYHLNKTNQCASLGIQLMHFWDYQMDSNGALIESMIMHKLGQCKYKFGARNTVVADINPATYRAFLNDNHLQPAINSKIKKGLFHNDTLVSVMGVGKSRFESNTLELHRFATKQSYAVAGAASKLLNACIRDVDTTAYNKIVSYADQDISFGNLYTQLGFVKIHYTGPSFFYFKNRTVYNRIKFQKHKLPDMLDIFDTDLTEWENMQLNGYNRCWTTGNTKYERLI
jgi:hypothetical protein